MEGMSEELQAGVGGVTETRPLVESEGLTSVSMTVDRDGKDAATAEFDLSGSLDLAKENARLRSELDALRNAGSNPTVASGTSTNGGAGPAAVDEEKLADKIRKLLMADFNQATERILEQQAEELQLSLLTRLKMETERFNEAQKIDAVVDGGRNDSVLPRRKSRKRRTTSKNARRKRSASTSMIGASMYDAVEPNSLPKPKHAKTGRSGTNYRVSALKGVSGASSILDSGETAWDEDNDTPLHSSSPKNQQDRAFSVEMGEEAIDILKENKEVEYPDTVNTAESDDESYRQEKEGAFEPIDVQSLDDINTATAELLRQSRELTMTVGDNEYVKGLKSVASLKKKQSDPVKQSGRSKSKSGKRTGKSKSKGRQKNTVPTGENGECENQQSIPEGKVSVEDVKEEEEEVVHEQNAAFGKDENAAFDKELKEGQVGESSVPVTSGADASEDAHHHHHHHKHSGPLNPLKNTSKFSGQPPPAVAPLAVKLGKREWENEVARNILVLYKANMNAQRAESMSQSTTSVNAETSLKDAQASQLNPSPSMRTSKKLKPPKLNETLPKIEGAEVKPSTMMQIKYGGAAKKSHNPTQIWFAGAGNVRAVWDGLVVTNEEEAARAMQKLTSDSKLIGELETLEKQGAYFKYIAIVEAILTARARIFERTENHWRLWRQLAVTANVFGVKFIDEGKFSQALQMLKHAQKLVDMTSSSGQDTLPKFNRYELKAFVNDSMSYYYFKRNKPHASLQYAEKAMKIHHRLKQWEHVAKCHLHTGAILSKLQRHDEAIRAMGQVLKMVEDERLETGGTSSQKICLIAVTYHNIAVEQLLLSRVMEACVSSQNARRLARLSLSYSNRWIQNFEATHRLALTALSTQKEVRTSLRSKEQANLFMDLSKTMYT